MKICVLTTAFPHQGEYGEGVFVWEAARAVAQQGHEVRVVAMHRPDAQRREEMDGVEIRRPPYWWPVSKEMLRKDVGGLPINWQRYPLARVQVVPFMAAHTLGALRAARGCDVIHAHWTLSAVAAYAGRLLHRRPIVATLQGSDVFQATKLPLIAPLTRHVLRRCDQVTVLSQALKRATAELGVPADDICIVPNGVNTARFTPLPAAERENVILYVGSLIRRKRVSTLIAALPAILQRLPDYRVVIVGDGPTAQDLRDLATGLGVAERVTFLGFQPQDEVRAWMQRARLFVLPSVEEGLGVVLLEALASGTPIVASGVGGIVDVVTEDVGRLVPPADPVALSEAALAILSDAESWPELSARARERATARYDWEAIAQQYIALYEKVARA